MTFERVVHDGRTQPGLLNGRRRHAGRRVHLEQPRSVVLGDHEIRAVQLKSVLRAHTHAHTRTNAPATLSHHMNLKLRGVTVTLVNC